jgi:hypothetical protein
MASATLERLTGYRVTNCPITVRPCKASCAGSASPAYLAMQGWTGFLPHVAASGAWVNSCGCATDCSCTTLCEVRLPLPVGRVDKVMLDGVEIQSTEYVVTRDGIAWAGAGECPWPACQDLTKPDTQPGTFSITYLNGYPPDDLAAYAAGTMAMEFARACCGGRCRLPSGVTAISRQGISISLVASAFPGGLTGIREVDSWVGLWNPQAIRQTSQVWSPDLVRGVR